MISRKIGIPPRFVKAVLERPRDSYHHRLIHDGGWQMLADAERGLRFIRPDGIKLNDKPIPIPDRIRCVFGPLPPSSGPGRQLEASHPRY